jgi:hypothetical protein
MVGMAGDLLCGRYPSFVYGRQPREGELPPVLCLHTAVPELFERMLLYLSENRYRTLTCDDYLERLERGPTAGERSVLLTFDDGHLSVWSIAYPLLKKYGMVATTYLIPGRMPAGQMMRPTMEDVWAGRASREEVVKVAEEGYTLCTWPENRAMHEAEVMDFQSHTHCHQLVAVSPRIMGFVSPQVLSRFHPFESAMLSDRAAREGAEVGSIAAPPLGTPIYASGSRMAEGLRYFPDEAVAAGCVERVEREDGVAFFEQDDWERQLQRIAADVVKQVGDRGRYETQEQRQEAIAWDLAVSKRTIERELPGKPVRHLAYPWGVGSEASMRASLEAGYASNFWGKVGGRLTNHVGDDPLRMARIGEDFFYLLQGEGRATLRGVLMRKLIRQWRKGSPYLSH